jgi:hypothetical protein
MRLLDKILFNDLFIAGTVRPKEHTDTYLLSYEDFDRVFRIIQKHAILRLDLLLEEGTEKRLNLLRNSGMYVGLSEEYRRMVLESYDQEESVYEDLAQRVCDHFEIDLQILMESQEELLQQNEDNQQ